MRKGTTVKNKYTTIHMWLGHNFSDDKKSCEKCGSQKKLQFALKHGEVHSHDREKYMVLCHECHTEYDHESKGKKISKTKRLNKYKILLESGTLKESEKIRVRELIEKHD